MKRAALIAFLFHAPGLWIARVPVPSAAKRENGVAMAVTLAATALAWSAASWQAALAVYLVGHFAWSARLAWWVSR
jgi:hypothetical protein